MITLFLQADEVNIKGKFDKDGKPEKRLAVKEYFKFVGGEKVIRGGEIKHTLVVQNQVDDAFIKAHNDVYAPWKAYVDAHDELLEDAKKQPGVPLFVEVPDAKAKAPVKAGLFHKKAKE